MDLPQQVIELDGLTLRRFNGEADLPELFRVIEESLEHLRPWTRWLPEHSLTRTGTFLSSRAERWESGEAFSYAIVLNGAIVGACTLFRHDDTPDRSYEIGYWLHPAATGRGVATRATRALVEQVFRLPDVDFVEIVHDQANHASGAIPARLGFVEQLRRPSERLAPAETGEDRVWRMTRDRAESLTASDTR
ncbi:GNAT family N-acetyltransferase [Streptomyces sp. NEAU-Y11]|uniref:GNAT family N-acetyltransferase n=1 Tax=Streptomyces cucumeris TaxID=2962890 RepID=UPI0020C8AA24|nr:GNAT family N-acetyltransferase [Streptomyces sp. NEAU-Y11]MCP9211915.1 GNAT family N-acetyltransferase [Streptomyces sp. NEAU-Y11]